MHMSCACRTLLATCQSELGFEGGNVEQWKFMEGFLPLYKHLFPFP